MIPMRKIITLLFTASLILSSCGSARLTPEEQQARAASVARAVNNLEMAIGITGVPHGTSRMTQMNKEYYIYLENGHVTTRLPFFGRAQSGGINELMGDASIVLENAPMLNVSVARSHTTQEGEYAITFQGRRDIRTIYTFFITLFDNGQADIRVSLSNNSAMLYYGELDFNRRGWSSHRSGSRLP